MLTRRRLVLFSLVVALTVSCVVGIVILFSERSTIVKEGIVKDVEYYIWRNHETLSDIAQVEYGVIEYFLDRQSVTILRFEDGEVIRFVGVIDDVEKGGKYRIIYHEKYVYAGNSYWSGSYYEIDSMEEIQ